ncbi:PqqD family protein [Thermophagus xiamenensis]|uniref:Coenzyme PQQ synthesis protein D (PqqD) n=1 Tax=Thermophagus xiamenensis TaxID=385682 RepID=A0A1I1XJ86_9BACT|nr:PqqD family protein [Thermophagus xiamenensis]SFE07427.1 Coenzyme PQQ synthesis protein D (PqqD) [Thermophagus xiamenensis]
MIDPDEFYQVNSENFVIRRMGNEMVLVPLANSVADMTSVIILNEVGSDILELLEEPANKDILLEKLLEKYDVNREILDSDIQLFLKNAYNKNVIRKVK